MSSTSQVIFSSQPRKLKLLFVLPSINTCCPVFPLHINLLGRDVLLLVFHFRVFYRRTVRLPRRPAVAGDRKKPNPDRPANHWLDSSAVMPVARRCCALVVTLPCELCRDAFPGKFLATAGRSLVGGAPWKPIFAFGGLELPIGGGICIDANNQEFLQVHTLAAFTDVVGFTVRQDNKSRSRLM